MTTTQTLNDVDIETVAALTEAITADPSKAATRWSARVDWQGGFRSEARCRDLEPIASDEPAALGGTDTAPNPVEQLLGALGNCLAVGLAANATARNITINALTIELDGDLDLSTFLGVAPGHAGFEAIRVEVDIDSDATPDAIEELIRHVTETSPVGHTLTKPIPVSVTRR